jgi:hypothetical protein
MEFILVPELRKITYEKNYSHNWENINMDGVLRIMESLISWGMKLQLSRRQLLFLGETCPTYSLNSSTTQKMCHCIDASQTQAEPREDVRVHCALKFLKWMMVSCVSSLSWIVGIRGRL